MDDLEVLFKKDLPPILTTTLVKDKGDTEIKEKSNDLLCKFNKEESLKPLLIENTKLIPEIVAIMTHNSENKDIVNKQLDKLNDLIGDAELQKALEGTEIFDKLYEQLEHPEGQDTKYEIIEKMMANPELKDQLYKDN